MGRWEGGEGKKEFDACAKVPRYSLTASLLSKNRISFSIKGTTPTVNFPVLANSFRATVLAPNGICWRVCYIPPPLAAVGPKLFSGKLQKEVAMFVVFGPWIMCRSHLLFFQWESRREPWERSCVTCKLIFTRLFTCIPDGVGWQMALFAFQCNQRNLVAVTW